MGLVDLFIWLMFVLGICSTIFTFILIKKHPEVLDKRNQHEDWKKGYWMWPPF